MTNKLIKWEFKSIIKQIGIVWIALPVMAMIFTLYQYAYYEYDWISTGNFSNIILSLMTFVYGGIFIAMIAVTTLIIIMRFYKGILKDEGYLMNTLPVKTGQLILSKSIVAVIVSIVSGIIGLISIFILSCPFTNLNIFLHNFSEIFESSEYVIYMIQIILVIIAMGFSKILELYLAMAIGQMSKKHKVLFSVLAYFGIQIICQTILSTILMAIPTLNFETQFWQDFTFEYAGNALLVLLVIQSVIYFILTDVILRKKLNLE